MLRSAPRTLHSFGVLHPPHSLRSSLRSPHYRYDEHEHIGYDVTGKKIIRQTRGDGLDRYLASQDDPNYGRTVYDERTGRDVVLSDRQINVVRRMLRGQYAHPEFEAYPDYIDYNTWKPEIHAIGNDYRPKSHFTPSKWEQQAVMKIVKGIKDGTIQLRKDRTPKSKEEPVYLLWGEDDTTGSASRGEAGSLTRTGSGRVTTSRGEAGRLARSGSGRVMAAPV